MSHALKKAKANSIKLGVAQLLHLNFFYIRYFWRPWLCLLNTAAHYFINSFAAARTTKGSFQIKKEMWQASMLLARARASIFKNQTVCRGKRKNDTTLGGRGGIPYIKWSKRKTQGYSPTKLLTLRKDPFWN